MVYTSTPQEVIGNLLAINKRSHEGKHLLGLLVLEIIKRNRIQDQLAGTTLKTTLLVEETFKTRLLPGKAS